jgi:hypothetical protein
VSPSHPRSASGVGHDHGALPRRDRAGREWLRSVRSALAARLVPGRSEHPSLLAADLAHRRRPARNPGRRPAAGRTARAALRHRSPRAARNLPSRLSRAGAGSGVGALGHALPLPPLPGPGRLPLHRDAPRGLHCVGGDRGGAPALGKSGRLERSRLLREGAGHRRAGGAGRGGGSRASPPARARSPRGCAGRCAGALPGAPDPRRPAGRGCHGLPPAALRGLPGRRVPQAGDGAGSGCPAVPGRPGRRAARLGVLARVARIGVEESGARSRTARPGPLPPHPGELRGLLCPRPTDSRRDLRAPPLLRADRAPGAAPGGVRSSSPSTAAGGSIPRCRATSSPWRSARRSIATC